MTLADRKNAVLRTTRLTLSGAHFSVKLILAINDNFGVFRVADHDSGIKIAKLKIADPRWRLCDSNFEVFEQLTQNLLYGYFFGSLITILKSELQNSKWRLY